MSEKCIDGPLVIGVEPNNLRDVVIDIGDFKTVVLSAIYFSEEGWIWGKFRHSFRRWFVETTWTR